jgi:hypothetical protein
MKTSTIKLALGPVDVEFTPEEIARAFWDLDSEGQAEFFNRLSEISQGDLPMQLQYVTDDDGLTNKGRWSMELIGAYSKKEVGE